MWNLGKLVFLHIVKYLRRFAHLTLGISGSLDTKFVGILPMWKLRKSLNFQCNRFSAEFCPFVFGHNLDFYI